MNVNCSIARFCYAAGIYRTELLSVVVRDYDRQLAAPYLSWWNSRMDSLGRPISLRRGTVLTLVVIRWVTERACLIVVWHPLALRMVKEN